LVDRERNWAEDIFNLLAKLSVRHGLRFTRDPPPHHTGLTFVLMEQQRLSFEIVATLQEDDELYIYLEGARFVFLPVEKEFVRHRFEKAVDGLITGDWRVRVFSRRRNGPTIKAQLESFDGNAWRVEHRYFHTFWPFRPMTSRVVRNNFQYPVRQ
jgi:hypothetical protein